MRTLKPGKGLKDLYPGLLDLVTKKSVTKAGGQRAKGKIDRSSRSLAASSVISEFLMVGVLIIFSIIVFAYLSGDMSTGTSDLQQSANNLDQQLDAVLTGPTVDPLSGAGSGQIGALNEVNTPNTDGSGSDGTVQPMASGPVTTLSGAVSTSAVNSLVYEWTIDKSVTPNHWDLFTGDTGTSQYTVTVSKNSGTSEAGISGYVTVTNGGAGATQNLAITVKLTQPPSDTVIEYGNVDVSLHPVLQPGESYDYPYTIDSVIGISGSYKVTADITITNHAGHVGTAFGPNPSTGGNVPTTQTIVNPTVHVVDSVQGALGVASDDYTWTYSRMFTDADEGEHSNVATITETGDSASASVTVNVYDLTVAKDASTSYTRTYDWSITKSVTPDVWDLFTGDSGVSDYTVSVTRDGFTDSAIGISGTITISNPAPIVAPIASVTDSFSSPVTITDAIPTSIPAESSVTLHYTASPTATTGGVNTATVELQNYDYDSSGAGTEAGTQVYSATANVVFGAPTVEVNPTVHVTDSVKGELGVTSADQTWTYSRTFTDADEGEHSNTATITETSQSASASVTVNVYDISVEKTASASFKRTYTWSITKGVTPAVWNLFNGDTGTSLYTVGVTKTGQIDSDFAVSGTITITNPAPIAAPINSVTDSFDSTSVTITEAIPTAIPAGGSVVLHYTATPTSSTGGVNTATVELQNYDYNSDNIGTASGTTPYRGTADVVFGTPIEVNKQITVEDTNEQSWTFSDTGSQTYTKTFDEAGTFGNTATIKETGQSASASVTVNVYDLTIAKTASTSYTKTYGWNIDKTVTPAIWNLFAGDSGTSQYTVSVTKDDGTDSNWDATGTVTVTNPAPIAATINSVSDILSSDTAVTLTPPAGVTFPYTLDAGQSLVFSYTTSLPSGDAMTNKATAVLQNHAYSYIGSPTTLSTKSYDASVNVDFSGATVNIVNDEVSVSDPNDPSGTRTFDASDSYQYTKKFTAPVDAGTHENTVTMKGDDDTVLGTASATVTVNSNVLEVSKTAQTSYTKTYGWTIDKTVTPDAWNLFTGDSGTSRYTVSVTKDAGSDSNWAVSGTITVHNPATIPATINSVADVLPGVTGVTVTPPGGVTFPYTLAAGGNLVLSYTTSLPSATATTNTATATLQNYDYDPAKIATASGTTDFSGQAAVDFSSATLNEVNAEVNVDDTNGRSWAFADTGSVSYDKTFMAADEGVHTNTATIRETGQDAQATVTVNVYDLTVAKTASASFTRTYNWEIAKSVTPDEWTLFNGDSGTSNYIVSVTKKGYTDSGIGVSGTITITNPAPIAAPINSVTDSFSSPVTITDAIPTEIPAESSVTLHYTASPTSTTISGTDTATVKLQNYVYDWNNAGTASGTQTYTATATADFSTPTTEVNKQIHVTDTNVPATTTTPWTFSDSGSQTYSRTFTTAGTTDNTATITETSQSASASVTVSVYDISVTKTADTAFTRTYGWSITKGVTPAVWNLLDGETGTSDYTVAVTKNGYDDSGIALSGVITITNPAPIPAPIKSVVDSFAGQAVAITEQIPTTIPASSHVDLHYATVPSTATSGTNTATVELQNYAYASDGKGTASGSTPYVGTAYADFSTPTTEVNKEINVDDTNGESWSFSDSDSQTYSQTFSTTGITDNTATIRETGQSASARVTVNVFDPVIVNDPVGAYERVYTWTIDKSADQTEMTLQKGQVAVTNYIVAVSATYEDGGYALSGFINVTNKAPIDVTINSITDVITPGTVTVSYTNEPSYPITLAPGQSIQLDYTATVPGLDTYTSTSTVVVQMHNYGSNGAVTSSFTRDFISTATINVNQFTMTETDKSITVTDTLGGDLGTAEYGTDTLPKSFSYPWNIGPYDTAGTYYIDNTATFTTCDTHTTGSDDWGIIVHVPDAGKITGYKFYDTNCNGVWDKDTELAIPGWKVSLTSTTDSTFVTQYATTNADGMYMFEKLPAGTYIVSEVFPATPTYVGTTDTSYTVTIAAGGYKECNFGNVALTPGIGGFTIGFWGNKNGQRIINSQNFDDTGFLSTLNLYNAGAIYPPFTDKVQIKSYLRDANAVDMRYMLSAQLIATELNVRHGNGYITENTVIYVGPSDGFMTVGYVLSNSLDALHTGDRSAQEYWKNILDGINNNNYGFLVTPDPKPPAPVYT